MKLVKSLLLGTAAGLCGDRWRPGRGPSLEEGCCRRIRPRLLDLRRGLLLHPGHRNLPARSAAVFAPTICTRSRSPAPADAIGFRARGRLQLDARTTTSYGLLRSVVRMEITRNSGTPFTDTGRITTSPDIAQAFIQFGGLTAGRVTTFFDNSDLPTEHMGTLRFSDAPDVDLLAYTFTFGNGFSATISIEDGLERRSNGFLDAASVGDSELCRPAGSRRRRRTQIYRHLGYSPALGCAASDPQQQRVREPASSGISRFP